MKKFFFLAGVIALFSMNSLAVIAQDNPSVFPPKYQVDTRIDNMGYWQKCAEAGLVPVQPATRIPGPVYTGSKVFDGSGMLITDSPDVAVTTQSSTQSENSIVVNTNDKDHVLNSNNSTPQGGFSIYGADWLDSFDGGATWGGSIQGPSGGNQGDPVALINLTGRYFINYIDNSYGQTVAYSDNQGTTWATAKVANGSLVNILDKNHMWVDIGPASTFKGNLYCGWMQSNNIYVSRSITNGTSWTAPVNISSATAAGSHNQGINFKCGPDGEVYAAWSVYDNWPGDEKAIGFAKSLDGGVTWQPAIRALNNTKGIRTSGVPQNMRCNSFPSMTVDLSNGPFRGTIYVVWPNYGVPGINSGQDVDVYMIKSTDKGATWSAPIRVNQDPGGLGKKHYLSWITCDQANGTLSCVFYDNRNVSNSQTETYMAYSLDGGATWTDMKVSDVAMTPSPIPGMASGYMGDYLAIDAFAGRTYPCWTDTRLGYAMTFVSPIDLIVPSPKIIYKEDFLNDTVYGNGNGQMDAGETTQLGLTMKNTGDGDGDSVTVTLSSPSPYITFEDSTEFYGDFIPNQSKTILNGYKYTLSNSMPGLTLVPFYSTARDSKDSITVSEFTILSHGPALSIIAFTVNDQTGGNNNGRLDPGETVILNVTTQNTGDHPVDNVISELSSVSPYITIINPVYSVGSLSAGQTVNAQFEVKVHSAAYIGSAALFHNYVHSQYLSDTKEVVLKIGLIVEDWETGNFTKFAWQSFGDVPWTIDPTVKYEQNYSAKSGTITDNQVSGLKINYNVLIDDSISFHWKVSTEAMHDKLKFYIDDLMVGQYAGNQGWKYSAFPVLAGPHTFKWEYVKDVSGSMGSDAAWVDFIIFPPEYKLAATAGPNGVTCGGAPYQLEGLVANYDSLSWTTSGTGTFSDPGIMNPLYTPSTDDITAGTVDLTVHAWGQYSTDTTSTMTLSIVSAPTAVAGNDQSVCEGTSVALSGTATNYLGVSWSTGGDGSFSNASVLDPVYTPGPQDILAGSVELGFHASASVSSCPDASDSLAVTIHRLPVVNLGNDTAVCANRTVTLDATTPNAASYLWTPGGKTTPAITVDSTGIGISSQVFTVVVIDNNGCEGSDEVTVTFKDCTGIAEIEGVSIMVYPNPSAGTFSMEVRTVAPQTLSLRVTSPSGEQVFFENNLVVKGSLLKKIDLGSLTSGTYLLVISNGKESSVKKLVIQK